MEIQLPHWWSLILCEASEALKRAVMLFPMMDLIGYQVVPTAFFGESTGVVPIFGHEFSE